MKIFTDKFISPGEKEYHLSIGKYIHMCVYYDIRVWKFGFNIQCETDDGTPILISKRFEVLSHLGIGPFGASIRLGGWD